MALSTKEAEQRKSWKVLLVVSMGKIFNRILPALEEKIWRGQKCTIVMSQVVQQYFIFFLALTLDSMTNFALAERLV